LTIAGLLIDFSILARAEDKNAVDPQVRKQIEALNLKYDEAFNQNEGEGVATSSLRMRLRRPEEASSGQQEIEDRYKVLFESHPNSHASKLDLVYAIGNRICAIAEWSMMQRFMHPSLCSSRKLM
jgi:hypothetical protein